MGVIRLQTDHIARIDAPRVVLESPSGLVRLLKIDIKLLPIGQVVFGLGNPAIEPKWFAVPIEMDELRRADCGFLLC